MTIQTPMSAAPRRIDGPAQRALCAEHSALLRQMAALQRRVSEQVTQQAARLAAVEAENFRLRAALVRSRTAVLWGLPPTSSALPVRRPAPRSATPVVERKWREAQAAICQTGCVGHAHAWLDDQGQCRRTGEACGPQSPLATQADGLTPPLKRADLA
jgi:hypothetical protein